MNFQNKMLGERSQDTKGQIGCDSICMKYLEKVKHYRQKANQWGPRAGRRGLDGYGVYFWGDDNVLDLERKGGCTTLNVLSTTVTVLGTAVNVLSTTMNVLSTTMNVLGTAVNVLSTTEVFTSINFT